MKKIIMGIIFATLVVTISGCGRKNRTGTYIDVLYLDPTNKNIKCTEEDASKNVNEYGTPTGIDSGCMKWYIYKDLGDSYKAILDHNTTARVQWNEAIKMKNVEVAYEDSNLKQIIDELKTKWITNNSYVTNVELISAEEIASITKNSSLLDISDRTAEFYFEGTGEKKQTLPIYTESDISSYYWLYDNTYKCNMEKEYWTDYFGCRNEDNNENYLLNNNTSYDDGSVIYGYWTGTTVGIIGKGNGIWFVHRYGALKNGMAMLTNYGIRPVITIPKSVLN